MAAIFEHGYALVVGIDDNKISRLALPTVAKDVQAVYDVLVHPERCAYQEDNVKLLSGADSTKNNILEAFMWLKEKVKADADATAVIYYSGHGYRDTATEEYYLIPMTFNRWRGYALTPCKPSWLRPKSLKSSHRVCWSFSTAATQKGCKSKIWTLLMDPN